MSTCDVAYVKSDYVSNSEKVMTTQEERQRSLMGQLLNRSVVNRYSSPIRNPKQSGVTLISPYIPTTRTFLIGPLESNRAYVFQMACVDTSGYRYISKQLFFKTGNYISKHSFSTGASTYIVLLRGNYELIFNSYQDIPHNMAKFYQKIHVLCNICIPLI